MKEGPLPGDPIVINSETFLFMTDTYGDNEHNAMLQVGDAGIFISQRDGTPYMLVLTCKGVLGYVMMYRCKHAERS